MSSNIAYLNSAARDNLRLARSRAEQAAQRLQGGLPASATIWLNMAKDALADGLRAAHDPSRPFPATSHATRPSGFFAGGAA